MGARLIKHAIGTKLRSVKAQLRDRKLYVTLLYSTDGKLLGVFSDHEAAQRYCDGNNVVGDMRSEQVQL